MNRITLALVFLVVAAPACSGSQLTASGSVSVVGCLGGYPFPCAAHDLAVHQETAPPGWNWNPAAGTIQIEPEFGERFLRVTDNNTMPGCWPTSTNTDMTVTASAEVPIFSSDENWFFLQDLNANDYLFSFNPATMQSNCVSVASTNHGQLPLIKPGFGRSLADAGILFAPSTSAPYQLWQFNAAQFSNSSYTGSLVFDMSTCPGLGWLPSMPIKAIGYYFTPQFSLDDNHIAWSIGPTQNELWLTMVYEESSGHCGWIDTRTGAVGGNLWGTTQIGGAFPLDWNLNGGPSTPVATGTNASGGTIPSGHVVKVQYSLVYESNYIGTGESSASAPQAVTVGGGSNAVSLPAPSQASFDALLWTHFNVYACDETVSGADCSPTLQRAANLGCSLASPAVTVTPNSTGSTTYTYVVEVSGNYCNTWASATINNSAATPNNTVSWPPVTGATHYRVFRGAPGSPSIWTNGMSTVDPTPYPADLAENGTGTTSFTDSGNAVMLLSAVGTIPCYTPMPFPSPIPTTGSSPMYNCSDTVTLTGITTDGPVAPTQPSNLGIWQHAMLESLGGNISNPPWIIFGPEQIGNVYWQEGASVSTWCNGTAGAIENPPFSYPTCTGHGIQGVQGSVQNGGTGSDANYDENYRTFTNLRSAAPMFSHFPGLDPQGGNFIDQHQSWSSFYGLQDSTAPFMVSTDAGAGAASSSFQGPAYIGRGWEREIFMMNPANGLSYRLAHHRTTGVYVYSTSCSTPLQCEGAFYHLSLAMVSPSGRFSIFDSDMEWHLGCEPGNTCTYNSNGQVLTGKSRVDVFLVEVK